jgi:hypothetical protein
MVGLMMAARVVGSNDRDHHWPEMDSVLPSTTYPVAVPTLAVVVMVVAVVAVASVVLQVVGVVVGRFFKMEVAAAAATVAVAAVVLVVVSV